MRKFLFVSALFILVCSFAHEYYVSIFRLSFNADNKRIEGSVKVFTDDLEMLLKESGHGVIAIDDISNKENIDKALAEELLKSISYKTTKGKVRSVSYVGYEHEDDLTWVYFTIKDIKNIKEPTMQISWMSNLYSGQVNIVHFTNGLSELSEYFNSNKQEIQFQFIQ